jgi:enamine deaminase RidA (YjgF/YER057c/UK114 family)
MSLLRVSRSLSSQLSRSAPGARSITRLSTSDPRMSGAVVHGDMVYLSGQVPAGGPAEWAKAPIEEQVSTTLDKVDSLLEMAGTDKSKVLSAHLWLKSMDDFAAMNKVWNDWVDPDNKPARACVESNMANPAILFEVMVVATK